MDTIMYSKKPDRFTDASMMRSEESLKAAPNAILLVIATIATFCLLIVIACFSNAYVSSDTENSMYMSWLKSK